MSPVAKKNLFKQEKLCKYSDPIFQVSETLHGRFAIQTQSNMFLSNRQRERQPTQQAFDESRTASARLPADGLSFLLACFPCGFTFVRVSVNELAPETPPPSSSFKLTFKIYPGEKLLGSHTQYDKLFMAVMLLGACMWHEFSLSVCLYAAGTLSSFASLTCRSAL